MPINTKLYEELFDTRRELEARLNVLTMLSNFARDKASKSLSNRNFAEYSEWTEVGLQFDERLRTVSEQHEEIVRKIRNM